MRRMLDPATTLRRARRDAGLTQAALAARAGTSQATVAAYEAGRKAPAVATLERLLASAGVRLAVARPPRMPTQEELADRARRFEDVLALAAALPTRHQPTLRFPRLDR